MVDTHGNKRALNETQRPLESAELEAALCCGCGKGDVKYRCPRCERITCSLQCCVDHKKQFDCNGKRDRTKYVQLKNFTDADLSSDFFFLEEVSRSTNVAARSRGQLNVNARRYTSNKKRKGATNAHSTDTLSGSVNPDIPADWLTRFPIAVQLFAEHSSKRGVALTLLAPGMSKRARNSSFMDKKKDILFWRLEWVFPSATVPVNHAEERANEKTSLFTLLRKYLMPTQENVVIREKLKKYAVPDWEKHILLLYRKEFTPASQPQYYRLNGNESLGSNLKRKAVVEFPVITVALVTDADQYPVAHDVIEPISSNATDPQSSIEKVEDMEIEEEEEGPRSKISSELLTGEGKSISETLFPISDEKSDELMVPTERKGVLIEELQVAAH